MREGEGVEERREGGVSYLNLGNYLDFFIIDSRVEWTRRATCWRAEHSPPPPVSSSECTFETS